MSGKLGRRAVVVGAGIGGLSAAGVLARYFDQVDVLERDQTPLLVETRSGTPQDRHAHGLLAGGLKALNEIYPDFDQDLAAAGAVTVNVPGDIRYEKPGVAELPQRDFGISMLSASRPLIEFGGATAYICGWKCPVMVELPREGIPVDGPGRNSRSGRAIRHQDRASKNAGCRPCH